MQACVMPEPEQIYDYVPCDSAQPVYVNDNYYYSFTNNTMATTFVPEHPSSDTVYFYDNRDVVPLCREPARFTTTPTTHDHPIIAHSSVVFHNEPVAVATERNEYALAANPVGESNQPRQIHSSVRSDTVSALQQSETHRTEPTPCADDADDEMLDALAGDAGGTIGQSSELCRATEVAWTSSTPEQRREAKEMLSQLSSVCKDDTSNISADAKGLLDELAHDHRTMEQAIKVTDTIQYVRRCRHSWQKLVCPRALSMNTTRSAG
jgi:hypothetical protein